MYELPLVMTVTGRLNEKRLRIQVVAGPRQVGKTTAVKQALKHYAKPFTYRLAEGLGVNPLAWLESEWQQARLQAKSLGEYLLVVDEIQKIVANWSRYASEAPQGSRRLALRNARLSLGDHGQLLIIFEKEYGNPYLYQRKDNNGESTARVDNDRRELQQFLQGKVGKAIEIEYRVLDRGGRITDNYVDLLSLVEPGAIQMSVETDDT